MEVVAAAGPYADLVDIVAVGGWYAGVGETEL